MRWWSQKCLCSQVGQQPAGAHRGNNRAHLDGRHLALIALVELVRASAPDDVLDFVLAAAAAGDRNEHTLVKRAKPPEGSRFPLALLDEAADVAVAEICHGHVQQVSRRVAGCEDEA